MPKKLYDYDPADALTSDDAIEVFLADAFETGDARHRHQPGGEPDEQAATADRTGDDVDGHGDDEDRPQQGTQRPAVPPGRRPPPAFGVDAVGIVHTPDVRDAPRPRGSRHLDDRGGAGWNAAAWRPTLECRL